MPSRKRKHRGSERSSSPSTDEESDDEGHVIAKVGDNIEGRYHVLGVLGQGAFGKVLHVEDTKRKERYALKVVRDVPKYREDAKEEASILRKLHRYSTSPFVISLKDMFGIKHRGRRHMCLMFPTLGSSLYEFMKANSRRGFKLCDVEAIGFQLLKAIDFCHSNRLVHTDLKPENILLVDSAYHIDKRSRDRDYRVPDKIDIRLIDFGGATFNDQHHAKIINTRQYRAPEVIVGLPWSYSSDLWSIGCILFELYKGHLLFPTHEDIEHLAMMEKVLDKRIPSGFIQSALEPFFESKAYSRLRKSRGSRSPSSSRRRASDSSDRHYYRSEQGSRKRRAEPMRRHKRRRRSESELSDLDLSESQRHLLDLLDWRRNRIHWPDHARSRDSVRKVRHMRPLRDTIRELDFCNLLLELLTVDPSRRITAREALDHPFFDYVRSEYA